MARDPSPWKDFFTSAVVVGIIDVTVLVAAIAWATRVGYVAQIFGGAIGVIAVTTFVGFFKEFAVESDGRMRAAITASFLLVYLFIFGLVAFSPQLQGLVRGIEYGAAQPTVDASEAGLATDEEPREQRSIAQDMFDSLSGVITAIVGFYFAGAAVEGAAAKLASRGAPVQESRTGGRKVCRCPRSSTPRTLRQPRKRRRCFGSPRSLARSPCCR